MDSTSDPPKKPITLKILGSEKEPFDLWLLSGATVGEIVKALSLKGYLLFSPYCLGYLPDEDEVFLHVSAGDRLYAYFPSMQPPNPCFSCQLHVRSTQQ